jgi:LuxR family maltose regulon positive regulatory protein
LLGSQLSTPNSLAISGFNGSHRYISDYFTEEVFTQANPALQSFMTYCSIFDEFSAPLCGSVLNLQNDAELIQELIDQQFFIQKIDGRQDWFTFHPLFKDYLVSKCKADEKQELYRSTALWFQERGEHNPAVEYGLRSRDEQTALLIIEPACEKAILDGNIQTISNWLEKWTQNGFQKRAELLVYNGWINALQGNFVQAQILKEQAEDALKIRGKPKDKDGQQNDQITQGKMAALQAFIEVMYSQQYTKASKEAKQALKLLPKNRSAWTLMALWAQAETQKRIDHIGKCVETLYEALRMGKAIGGKVFYYAVVNSLAAALHFHGRRAEALEVCQKVIADSSDSRNPALGGIYAWIGRLSLEANQMETALENIRIGVQLNEQPKASLNLIFANYYASQIYQAAGQEEKALDFIQKAKRLASNVSLSDECWLDAWEANLYLLQGSIIQVEHWLRMEGPKLDQKPDYLNMEMLLVYTRYLIQKEDINNAAKRLNSMERLASRRGYHRWLLTIYLLQAIIWEKKNKHAQALECIKRTLHIAAPEEYQRAFLDEDPLVLRLVQEVSVESPAFVMRLLRSASSLGEDKKEIPASILPDPLSEREMQVLKLLASGKKGPQIADELFIAYSTVRTHLKSIHRKLDVHNRQELLDKIRLLELI